MNIKQTLLLICTYFISYTISAQCELHFEYENTGSNMTVLFASSASQNISSVSNQSLNNNSMNYENPISKNNLFISLS